MMLSDFSPIRYRRPERTPIQVRLESGRVLIDCCFRYNRPALQPGPDGQIPADLIEEGIRQAWSGDYQLNLPGMEIASPDQPVHVDVRIYRDGRRRAAPISLRRLFVMPAHVISPLWRRIWGIFRTGQLESLGANWSPRHPGRMVLPTGLPPALLRQLAAHEAGHLFGLGDAYGAIYRFYYGVPGKEHYMMFSNQQVHPEEIVMLLRAHQRGRMQFFPRAWNSRRFIKGLRADLAARTTQLERQLAQWREHRRGSAK